MEVKKLNTSETIKIDDDDISSFNAPGFLKAVQRNDIPGIKKYLKDDPHLLEYQYTSYDNEKIFTIASNDRYSMDKVEGDTLEILIRNMQSAKYTEPSQNDKWEPIHYTALNSNFEKMEAIVKNLECKNVNSLVYCCKEIVQKYQTNSDNDQLESYSNNALHILLKYATRNDGFYKCCNLLINKGINMNQADSNGTTPLDLIDLMKEVEKNRLQNCAKKGEKGKDPVKLLAKVDSKEKANGYDGSEDSVSSCTLLQLCCAKGLTAEVEQLIKKGANREKTCTKNPKLPIMIAIEADNEDIVALLLTEIGDAVWEMPNDILLKVQKIANSMISEKYLKIVLRHLSRKGETKYRQYLQETDDEKRTVLHYTVLEDYHEVTQMLLDMGASLIEKDVYGTSPLYSIDPEALEKIFDKFIRIDDKSGKNNVFVHKSAGGKHNFSVELNYTCFVSKQKDNLQESEFLHHMIKVARLNHLLKHPFVSIFLALKWQKCKWPVYINLFVYFIAYLSLLFFGYVFVSELNVSIFFLLVVLLLLLFREFAQIVVYKWDYFKRVEALVDFSLIVGILYIIAADCYPYLKNRNLLVAYSGVFLTSTLGIFLQLANFSFFTIKVIILQQIAISFFQYMAFYVFPLVAFFFCFYMLSDQKDDIFFLTAYDTITMYAGELTAGYPKKQFLSNPIFGHLIFLLFVVLIGIILHNLLIGLAVSDLQEIQKQAEFIDKKERSKYIANIEQIIVNRVNSSKIFKSTLEKLLAYFDIFGKKCKLKIQHDGDHCFLIKNKCKISIPDSIYKYLQEWLKTQAHKTKEDPYTGRQLYEKLQELERLIASQDKKFRLTTIT